MNKKNIIIVILTSILLTSCFNPSVFNPFSKDKEKVSNTSDNKKEELTTRRFDITGDKLPVNEVLKNVKIN